MPNVHIYTDGSHNPQSGTGAWVAILYRGDEKTTLSGTSINTTHQRMELTAVIEAVLWLQENRLAATDIISIFSDSQYVIKLPERLPGLRSKAFISKAGKPLPNGDLLLAFQTVMGSIRINWIKIKAHQKKTDVENPNIEADRLSRLLVRQATDDAGK